MGISRYKQDQIYSKLSKAAKLLAEAQMIAGQAAIADEDATYADRLMPATESVVQVLSHIEQIRRKEFGDTAHLAATIGKGLNYRPRSMRGKRTGEIEQLVIEAPGITIQDIAKELNISYGSVYGLTRANTRLHVRGGQVFPIAGLQTD